jgi:NAD(P)-dependent dehydrogenase (short-subunit alcohol dehydrogenase family)
LAEEAKENHIDINVIAPGAVNTKILDDALAAGEKAVGKERYAAMLKQKEEGGASAEKAAELCVFLASGASDGLSGKFLSAVWDDYKSWDAKKIKEIMASDAYTLRRVKPKQ